MATASEYIAHLGAMQSWLAAHPDIEPVSAYIGRDERPVLHIFADDWERLYGLRARSGELPVEWSSTSGVQVRVTDGGVSILCVLSSSGSRGTGWPVALESAR